MTEQTGEFKPNFETAASQNQRIIDHLLAGNSITTMDLVQAPFFCASPTKRISDVRRMLKNKGYTLNKELVGSGRSRYYRHFAERTEPVQPSLLDELETKLNE